jgi:hypothetical protein
VTNVSGDDDALPSSEPATTEQQTKKKKGLRKSLIDLIN